MKRVNLFLIVFLAVSTISFSQVFNEAKSNLMGVMQPVGGWINAGHNDALDVLLMGDNYVHDNQKIVSQLAKNSLNREFVRVKNGFPPLHRGASATGDFDDDGDDDIIMTGLSRGNQVIIRLYRNDGPFHFTPIKDYFTPVTDGSIDWGDFDNDGDLDLIITGKEYNNKLSTKIYRNDKGIFSEMDFGIPGVYQGSVDWGDYDKDGDLDILITGNVGGKPYTAIYKYDNGRYAKLAQTMVQLWESEAKWGDLNNDGNLDFFISGADKNGNPVAYAYKNELNLVFKGVPVNVRPLKRATVDLGDYDADGDLDILMSGESLERSYTLVYRNNLGFSFEDIVAGLPGVANGLAQWGDYDHDGDLDILLAGITICYDFIGTVYTNNTDPPAKIEENPLFVDTFQAERCGPYYYYVFSSCYCDPYGDGDGVAYHMYISNIHKQYKSYELNYKFNGILIKTVPNWGDADRGYRTSNAFETREEAVAARQQVIESYQAEEYKVHFINW
ncbi:MAG: VCBS repeat-containing protein [Chlorobi bacterium]|nr:VCBS repeat-containing protein [Chlorobiota bacterium]